MLNLSLSKYLKTKAAWYVHALNCDAACHDANLVDEEWVYEEEFDHDFSSYSIISYLYGQIVRSSTMKTTSDNGHWTFLWPCVFS